MNTLEILYQAFRVRYSLNQLQQILDRGCRLAVLAPEGGAETIRGFLGEPIVGLDNRQPEEDLIVLDWQLDDASLKELRTCDACVVYFPDAPPEVEALEQLAARIPLQVKTLWLCESEDGQPKNFHEQDLTLPTVRSLPAAAPGRHFLRLLLASLPQISLVLARDWTDLRELFCQTLTRRTALRNGVRAGISSLPLKSVPGIGPALAMLATSAETMMLTSSQLRLSFVIAAVHGRPLDFFDRISELWPIIGSAFGFRGLSRYLVKVLPGGFRPGTKASIAFTGTYAVGEASRLYYHMGQPSSDEVRRELMRRSHEEGAKEAQLLFRRILAGQGIDEVGVGGTDVVELVEGLTNIESALSDPVVGEAISEASDHQEQLLHDTVAEELSKLHRDENDDSPAHEPTVEMEAIAVDDASEIDGASVENATSTEPAITESSGGEHDLDRSEQPPSQSPTGAAEQTEPASFEAVGSAEEAPQQEPQAEPQSRRTGRSTKKDTKTQGRGKKKKPAGDS